MAKRASVAKRRAVAVVEKATPENKVRTAVLALEDRSGRITPETVVRAAKAKDSPLHSHFEWDDEKAGHAYRIEQARSLIRSVQVVITTEERVISTVHYVRDPGAKDQEQGYVSLSKLRTEPENARVMLRSEFMRASACLHRAEDLADALGMKREVAALAKRVDKVREKVEAQVTA